ncbi:rapid alkalinization factor-like [Typha angustifolia]|uniref:rapid alkalinization factor-like n=1 Tax=Typha angustifolia TaxID=59011 RepID=UPI003C2E7DEC
MATPRVTSVLLLLLASLALISAVGSATSGVDFGWIPARKSSATCRGTVGECLGLDAEFDLVGESNRRILAAGSSIGYDALRQDSVPCSQRGASYYNCQPGASANPYSRGCSAITQCRGS